MNGTPEIIAAAVARYIDSLAASRLDTVDSAFALSDLSTAANPRGMTTAGALSNPAATKSGGDGTLVVLVQDRLAESMRPCGLFAMNMWVLSP